MFIYTLVNENRSLLCDLPVCIGKMNEFLNIVKAFGPKKKWKYDIKTKYIIQKR